LSGGAGGGASGGGASGGGGVREELDLSETPHASESDHPPRAAAL